MIYISTGGFRDQTGLASAETLVDAGFSGIELSGGLYHEGQLQGLKSISKKAKLQLHNYFPPPPQSFVLNLASSNPEVSQMSQTHIETALQWSSELGCSAFGFHAGFLLDPHPNELGRKIKMRQLDDRAQALQRFAERVTILAERAEGLGIQLWIENNVLSPANLAEFGANPLLLVDPDEIISFFKIMPKTVGLLLDVAHLQVSARALKFSSQQALERLSPLVDAAHLSDNDGTSDSNEPVRSESWFWPKLRKRLSSYTVEVYGADMKQLRQQVDLVQKKISQGAANG